MRPTVEEQLLGVDRLLDAMAADPELGEDSAALVAAARKQLQRLAGSCAARPTFLRWDNASMAALLHDLVPLLPDDLQRAVAETAGRTEPAAAEPAGDAVCEHTTDLDARNDTLRAVLVVVIDGLPDDDAGNLARRSIADHLLARAAANPALHKHPQLPSTSVSTLLSGFRFASE